MCSFTIGSFASFKTPYEQVLEEYLLPSCKKWNLKSRIFSATNYGNWHRNVAEKPKVIKEMLDFLEDSNELLVFLDADSTIEQYPKLFEEIPEEYDIGFHTLDWNTWYGSERNIKEVLSGTMFFRNRQKVKELCKEWYRVASETNKWEQKVLEQIIGNYDLKIYPLPLEYCYIKNRPGNKEPLVKLDPVILHHQISRFLKKRKL